MRLYILLCVTLILQGCRASENDLNDGIDPIYKERIVAHRGVWKDDINAQNSINSIKDAIPLGIWGCEIDLWETKDGEIILNHDMQINELYITESTYKELNRSLPHIFPPLPKFQDALDAVAYSDISLLIEIKYASADKLKQIIAKHPENSLKLSFMSFSQSICRSLISNGLSPTYLLTTHSDIDLSALSKQGYSGVAIDMNVLKENINLFFKAKELDLRVLVWTVDNVNEIEYFLCLGIDYVITNIVSEQLFKLD